MSKMARDARAAMKAKARALGGSADTQPLSSAAPTVGKPRMARKAGGAVDAKVTGAKSAARADRKPRAKKDAGGDLGFPEGMSPAEIRKMVARNAMRDAMGMVTMGRLPSRALVAPSRAVTTTTAPAAASAVAPSAPSAVSTAVRGAEEVAPRVRPAPYRAEGTVNVSPSVPPIPRGSPRSLFMAANRAAELGLGDDGAIRERPVVDRGIGTRTDRMDDRAPDMVVRATRPAPVAAPAVSGPETTDADRLNAISLGQSRMGPIQRDEAPAGAAEAAAAQRMMERRRLIESTPTTGGEVGTFRRGGIVKNTLKGRKSKAGKPRC